MNLTVSVIIPTYNRKDLLKEAVQSILNQSYINYEVLIIDDYSIDNTEKIVRQFISEYGCKIKYFKNERKKGVSGARNTGLHHAKGKYIAFLDSDDIWESNKLQIQVGILDTNKEIKALFAAVSFFGQVENGYGKSAYTTKLLSKTFWNSYGKETWVAKNNIGYFILKNGSPFRTPTFIFRHECLTKVGLFNEDMSYYEDAEFLLKFFCIYKVGYNNLPLCKVRRHQENQDNSTSKFKKCESEIKLTRELKVFNETHKGKWHLVFMNRLLSNAYIRLSTFYFKEGDIKKSVESIQLSLKIMTSAKAILRLCLLQLVPSEILKKISHN